MVRSGGLLIRQIVFLHLMTAIDIYRCAGSRLRVAPIVRGERERRSQSGAVKLRFKRSVEKWSDHPGEGFEVDQKRIVAVGTWQFDKRNVLVNSQQF